MRLVDDTSGAATQRVRRSDALVPGLLAIGGAVEMAGGGYEPLWLGMATYVLASGALVLRRAAPLAVPPAVGAIYALTPLLGFDISDSASWILVLAFACLSAGLLSPRSRRYAGLASVVVCLATVVAGLAWFTTFEPDLLFGLILCVGSWALGVALRGALDRTRRLGAEAERVRIERSLAADRAAASERGRIAAELHDALAHALGAMVVQASVASDLIRRDAGAAAAALEAVAQAGRHALGETGRLLRLLRDDRDELGLQLAPPATERKGRDATAAPGVSRAAKVRRADLLLPALFGVIGTVEIVWQGYEPLWGLLGACWLAAGVLCARRALPLAMPIVVSAILVAGGLIGGDTDEPSSTLLVLALALVAAGLHVPRSRAAAGLASVLAAIALLTASTVASGELADVVLDVALVVPWAVGVAFGETLERARTLAAEAERARAERDLEAERGAAAERRRIARELHDVLANSLSVMIVQASLAAQLADIDPVAAGAAVGEVERSGRTALGETGRLLRLIQVDDVTSHPQHGLADLPALADEYARAGLGIDLEVAGVAARLPMSVELSTYRIVQEGLTNVLKHAPGSPVRVRLACEGSDVAIEVRNGPAVSAAFAVVTGGHGLVGLRERVTLFGGALDAGPTPDGGFVLAATLPVQEPA